jgi:hypothetical protein
MVLLHYKKTDSD